MSKKGLFWLFSQSYIINNWFGNILDNSCQEIKRLFLPECSLTIFPSQFEGLPVVVSSHGQNGSQASALVQFHQDKTYSNDNNNINNNNS